MYLNPVRSFEHLKARPNADQALMILQRVASLVKPIMKRHGWQLPVLAEFFPDSPNLLGLNINHGEKILLRLRPPHSPSTFIEEHAILDTMLHELAHNVHGPHDDSFWRLLAQLQDEYQALRRSGYAGEGFFAPGRRLGQGVSHNVPIHETRVRALKAAERRAHLSRISGHAGKLGGREISGLSPSQVAAMAAEQRAQAEKFCGNSAQKAKSLVAEEARKAQEESTLTQAFDPPDMGPEIIIIDDEVVFLVDSLPEHKKAPAGASTLTGWACIRCTLMNNGGNTICELCEAERPEPVQRTPNASVTLPSPPRNSNVKGKGREESVSSELSSLTSSKGWTCTICTLFNEQTSLQCAACTTRRPFDPESRWTCLNCDAADNSHDFWSCRNCGEIKSFS